MIYNNSCVYFPGSLFLLCLSIKLAFRGTFLVMIREDECCDVSTDLLVLFLRLSLRLIRCFICLRIRYLESGNIMRSPELLRLRLTLTFMQVIRDWPDLLSSIKLLFHLTLLIAHKGLCLLLSLQSCESVQLSCLLIRLLSLLFGEHNAWTPENDHNGMEIQCCVLSRFTLRERDCKHTRREEQTVVFHCQAGLDSHISDRDIRFFFSQSRNKYYSASGETISLDIQDVWKGKECMLFTLSCRINAGPWLWRTGNYSCQFVDVTPGSVTKDTVLRETTTEKDNKMQQTT